jgi:hypothetical protein
MEKIYNMSNKVSKIKKEAKKLDDFLVRFYATPYGSLLKTCIISLNLGWDRFKIYNRVKNAVLPFLDDDDFIEKTVKAFGIDFEEVKKIPMVYVTSDLTKNSLFMPFFRDENGEMVVVPLNKDGSYPQTYMHATTITEVTWEDK